MPGRGRGRGRGGGRGRGRGRGSSRGRNRGSRPGSHPYANQEREDKSLEKKDSLDISNDVRSFFRGAVGFDHHFEAQTHSRERYIAGLATLLQNGVQISQSEYNRIKFKPMTAYTWFYFLWKVEYENHTENDVGHLII